MVAVLLAKVRANEQLGQAIVGCAGYMEPTECLFSTARGSAMKSTSGVRTPDSAVSPQTLLGCNERSQSIPMNILIHRHSRGEVGRGRCIASHTSNRTTSTRPDTPSTPPPPCQQLPPVAPPGVWQSTSSVPPHRSRCSLSFRRCTASPSNSTWSNSSALN